MCVSFLLASSLLCGVSVMPGAQEEEPVEIAGDTTAVNIDLMPVSDGWLTELVEETERLVKEQKKRGPDAVLGVAGQWATVHEVLPSSFKRYFKEAYWSAMKEGVTYSREHSYMFVFLGKSVAASQLFPERAHELGLNESDYERALWELRRSRNIGDDLLDSMLNDLVIVFPDHREELENEFGDVLEMVARDAISRSDRAWLQALERTDCRCEWSDAEEVAFIDAFLKELSPDGRSLRSVNLERLREHRADVLEEVQARFEEDKQRRFLKRIAKDPDTFGVNGWHYYHALLGMQLIKRADALLAASAEP